MYKRSVKHKKKSEWFYAVGHRTRTERKKVKRQTKQERARNKKLLGLYPFLVPVSEWDMKPTENTRFSMISLWDEVPKGWTKNFGRQMCEEIKNTLKSMNYTDKIYFEQCKEKYGALRIYTTAPREVLNIISVYEAISEHVCVRCGKPHVPMLNLSWISPYCKECFSKFSGYKRPYEDFTPKDEEHWKIPTVLQERRFSPDKELFIEEIDITDRVKKVEERWEQIKKKQDKNKRKGKKNANKNTVQKEEKDSRTV